MSVLTRTLGIISGASEAAIGTVGLARDAPAQARTLRDADHRPWPIPNRPWLQGQTWCDTLFAHWPVDPEALRPAVPAELELDIFDGSAWVGITPFEVRGLRPRGTLPTPRVSRFPEVNVRTYTTVDGKAGLWFLSLDAASRVAIAAARRAYRFPYFRARGRIERDGAEICYRFERAGEEAALSLRCVPTNTVAGAQPGSIEHFLTERYCAYTLDEERRVQRAEIHHPPWPLQSAEAEVERNTLTRPHGIDLPGPPALLHFAARQDVVLWALEPA